MDEKRLQALGLPSSKSKTRCIVASVGSPTIPISDDIQDSTKYSDDEKEARCKLASLYRLMDVYGWTNGIWNHITVRLPKERDRFLNNPLGLLYSEITAGSLVTVDTDGKVTDSGNTCLGFNTAGFLLHSPIYEAREDINCIIHTHVPSTVAVATMKKGLLPLTQDAAVMGEVSYHEFHGVFVNAEEKGKIVENLGPKNKIMFLRSHGIVVCGSTVEDAFNLLQMTIHACEQQVRMLGMVGIDELVIPSEEAVRVSSENADSDCFNTSTESWKPGQLEFEAEMRSLDYAGYKTGYPYKVNIWKNSVKLSNCKEEEPENVKSGVKRASKSPSKRATTKPKRSRR